MKTMFRAVAVLLLGALVLAGCSSKNSPSVNSSGTTTTAAAATGSTTTSAPTATATTSTSTSTTSASPQNLSATPALKSAITAAYVAHNGLPADQVAGTAPGSVYYGYLPSTGVYWAIAGFVPTANSTQQTQVSMQDDGCCGIFTQSSGGPWTFVSGYLGEPCPGQIPAALETLWNLTYPGDCPAGTTTT